MSLSPEARNNMPTKVWGSLHHSQKEKMGADAKDGYRCSAPFLFYWDEDQVDKDITNM